MPLILLSILLELEIGGEEGRRGVKCVWESLSGGIELGGTIPKPEVCTIRISTSLLVVIFCIKHAVLK